MKVLQINAVYGHGSTGVITRDIEQLCEMYGIECYVASPDSKVCEANRGYKIGNIIDHKLHALFCRIAGKQAYFSRWATKRLLAYINKIKPDIVHLHNLHSNYIHLNMLLQYLAKENIRTVITLHDCWFYTGGCFHYTIAGCMRWLEECGNCPKKKKDTPAYLFDCSDSILADRKKYFMSIPRLTIIGVSNWISNEARRAFFSNTSVVTIRNGVDLNIFKYSPSDFRHRLGLEGKYIILGPASKWLQPENKSVLAYFSEHMQSDEVLLLFGAIDCSLLVPNNVRLYGYIKNPKELAELYTCADVFVNTTREDSLSLINIEVQACNTPVVTFDATGPKETVDGVCGYAVHAGDSEQLYLAVKSVRMQKKEYFSKHCREFISRNFEKEANYHKYISLYKQLVDE